MPCIWYAPPNKSADPSPEEHVLCRYISDMFVVFANKEDDVMSRDLEVLPGVGGGAHQAPPGGLPLPLPFPFWKWSGKISSLGELPSTKTMAGLAPKQFSQLANRSWIVETK